MRRLLTTHGQTTALPRSLQQFQVRKYASSRSFDKRRPGSRLSRVRDPSTTQLRKPSSIIGKSSVPAQTPTLSQPASPHHVHALSRQRSRFDVTEANNSAKTPTSTATASQSFFGGIDQYVPVNGIEALEGKPPPSLPGDLLDVTHSAAEMLSQPALVVVRQIEMMNVLLGYEQANRYRLVNPQGEDVGYLAESEGGFGRAIGRQVMRGHRPFSCVVLDLVGNVVLRVERPFSVINSRISVYRGPEEASPENKIGECQQVWHPYRRKYSLYHRERLLSSPGLTTSDNLAIVPTEGRTDSYDQFASIDARLLAWDFYLQSESGRVLASINRNFMGFGREVFTDTGQYVLRFDKDVAEAEITERLEKGVGLNEELSKAGKESKGAEVSSSSREMVHVPDEDTRGLTLDQRAILLATAITVDIDYFSRQGGGGIGMPMLWMPMPGGTVPSEVPPSTGQVPADIDTSPTINEPYASPEYGESPGIGDSSYDNGSGWGDQAGQDGLLNDPWSPGEAASDSGGFWSGIGDLLGGGSD